MAFHLLLAACAQLGCLQPGLHCFNLILQKVVYSFHTPPPQESPQGEEQPGLVTLQGVGRTGNKERKGATKLEGSP